MKKASALLLFIFSLTILLPVAHALVTQQSTSVFIVDEEQSEAGEMVEIKDDKKEVSNQFYLAIIATIAMGKQKFHSVKNASIPAAPALEKNIPPPNC